MRPEEFDGMLELLTETDHLEERSDLKEFLSWEVRRLYLTLKKVGLPDWIVYCEEPSDEEHTILKVTPETINE